MTLKNLIGKYIPGYSKEIGVSAEQSQLLKKRRGDLFFLHVIKNLNMKFRTT